MGKLLNFDASGLPGASTCAFGMSESLISAMARSGFLSSQRLPRSAGECEAGPGTPAKPSYLGEQHRADHGERAEACNGSGSQLNNRRVFEGVGQVLLRAGRDR